MKSIGTACFVSGVVAIFVTLLPGQRWTTESTCGAVELPPAVRRAVERLPKLKLSCRINPPLIDADLDGDGARDFALLVVDKVSHERGFLLIFGTGKSVLAGAGHAIKYGATQSLDLNFDQWELYPKSRPVEAGVGEHRSLKLRGDALLVSYHETASGLFYWDGKAVRWYQQGD